MRVETKAPDKTLPDEGRGFHGMSVKELSIIPDSYPDWLMCYFLLGEEKKKEEPALLRYFCVNVALGTGLIRSFKYLFFGIFHLTPQLHPRYIWNISAKKISNQSWCRACSERLLALHNKHQIKLFN